LCNEEKTAKKERIFMRAKYDRCGMRYESKNATDLVAFLLFI